MLSLVFLKELARMKINLASSGIVLPSLVNVSCQTPANESEMLSEDESELQDSSHSSLHDDKDESRTSIPLVEMVITEPSPLVGESLDESEVSRPQTIQRSSKKHKRKKQMKKDHSRKQTARRPQLHSNFDYVNEDDELADEQIVENRDKSDVESTTSSKMSVKMENKVSLAHSSNASISTC